MAVYDGQRILQPFLILRVSRGHPRINHPLLAFVCLSAPLLQILLYIFQRPEKNFLAQCRAPNTRTNMKKNAFSLLASAALFHPLIAPAELLIYKGVSTDTETGGARTLRLNLKVFLIIDHDTANFARISYTSYNGSKRVAWSQYTNAHIVQVIWAQSKTCTVLAHIPNDCDAQEAPGREGVYFKGSDSVLSVSTNATTTFPRTLTDNGVGLGHFNDTGDPFVTEGSYTRVFNRQETIKSNTAGETLDVALNMLLSYVESL